MTRNPLPFFRYHPEPITTGVVKTSDAKCECCDQACGYLYGSSIYGVRDIESLCPWCIASGEAAMKLGASFSDAAPLASEGVDSAVIIEVTERTPGYDSWQQESWQTHCKDACAFLGDANPDDLEALKGAELALFLEEQMIDVNYWQDIVSGYQKGGSPAVYKFQCLHCGANRYSLDFK